MFSSVILKGCYELCSIWNSTETVTLLDNQNFIIIQIVTGSPGNMKIHFAKYPFGQSYVSFVTNKIKVKINKFKNKIKIFKLIGYISILS